MKFQKNVLLKNHTSFKIGGPAKYFFEARNLKDLIKALKEAKKQKFRFLFWAEALICWSTIRATKD